MNRNGRASIRAERAKHAASGALGPEVPTRQWLGRWNRTSALVEKRCPWIRGFWRWRKKWSCWASAFEEGHIRGKIPIVYRTMCIHIYYYMILHVCVCVAIFPCWHSNFEVWYLPCWDKLMEGWPDFRTERGTLRSADRTWHTETLISWCFICIGNIKSW